MTSIDGFSCTCVVEMASKRTFWTLDQTIDLVQKALDNHNLYLVRELVFMQFNVSSLLLHAFVLNK